MRFTPLKLALCLSLLIHGSVLSAYYAIQHGSNIKRVELNHERALEVEIVSEPVPDASRIPTPLAVKAAEVQKTLPPATPHSQSIEIKQAVLEEENSFPPAKDEAVEVDLFPQPEPVESETKSVSQPVRVEAGSNPAAEIGNGVPANYFLNTKPVYPVGARQHKQEGVVVLAIEVNREGFPDRIQIVQSSGFQLLDEAAVKAVNQWRFSPARLGNMAVASQIQVPIRFKLSDP
jgi:protein TonB